METKIRYNGKIHKVRWLGDPRSRFHQPPLHLFGNEFGPTHLIGGDLDSAFDELLDDSTPIPIPEANEAFSGDDLNEGYYFQPNAEGSGIVFMGFYWWVAEYKLKAKAFQHLRKGG